MASNNRQRVKNRRPGGSFTALPHSVFRATGGHPAPVAVLSKAARCLLVDIAQQLTGSNNGNLAAAPRVMAPYGWTSRGTLDAALVECIAQGFLMQTRQGGRNRCSLYGVTWRGIDPGPHDARPDPVPARLWLPEHQGQRDPTFVRRWQAALSRRVSHDDLPSRYSDKPSRYSDKSDEADAA